jgi:HEAT repeat protein
MPALGREAVPLIAAAMDRPDPVARLSAMQAAKELGGRKDAAGLEQVIGRGLRDTDAAVVLAALDAAGARGEPALVLSPRLIELAGSKVDAVQASATQALLLLHPDGKFPFDQLPDAKSRVVAYLGVYPDAPVVSSAIAAISSLGDKEALRIYSGILEGNDVLMAVRACHGLAAMGEAGRPAVPLIEAALKRWKARALVTSAEDALRRLRETSK